MRIDTLVFDSASGSASGSVSGFRLRVIQPAIFQGEYSGIKR